VPTYDYQCRSCGVITEVVRSMLEDGPSECERCGGELRRVFHPTGIIFKGGGFYKTDTRSSSSTSTADDVRQPASTSGQGEAPSAPADGGSAGRGPKQTPSSGDISGSGGSGGSGDSGGSGGSGGSAGAGSV